MFFKFEKSLRNVLTKSAIEFVKKILLTWHELINKNVTIFNARNTYDWFSLLLFRSLIDLFCQYCVARFVCRCNWHLWRKKMRNNIESHDCSTTLRRESFMNDSFHIKFVTFSKFSLRHTMFFLFSWLVVALSNISSNSSMITIVSTQSHFTSISASIISKRSKSIVSTSLTHDFDNFTNTIMTMTQSLTKFIDNSLTINILTFALSFFFQINFDMIVSEF